MDRILFLGTAGDIEAVASQRLASGGILLQFEGEQFHLDPGPGSLVRMRQAGVNPRETIAVIATNATLLRAGDVNATVGAMTLEGLDPHGVLLAAKSVLEGEHRLLLPRYGSAIEGLVPLSPGQKIGVNSATFFPLPASGKDEAGIGLRILVGKMTIGYTGDTSMAASIGEQFKGVDLLIINCPHPATVREEGSLNLEDAERLLRLAGPKQAVLTSFGSKIQDTKAAARELQRTTKVHTIAASDGYTLELG